MIESTPQLEDFQLDEIVNSSGISYKEYRKTLKPNYWRVGIEIAFGYVMLIAGIIGAIFIQAYESNYQWIAGIIFTAYFGYAHYYIQLFLHEAAHFNIAKTKKSNDFLANTFICSLIGQNIKSYRKIHFIHHRELGTPNDSEHSYFEALTFRFILESLTGIRTAKVLLSYEKRMVRIAGEGKQSSGFSLPEYQVFIGVGIHGLVFLLALMYQSWILILTWLAGFFMIFPFLVSIRQLMEHRDENAPSDKDFTKFSHGKVNRMFGSGPIASMLGGAGFNRHLLHHWEPQISYTNLAEVEKFLYDTNVASTVVRHQTGYFHTFMQLYRWK